MTGTSVQALDITPVGRIEGDLEVRVDIEHGQVVNAWTRAELLCSFDVILYFRRTWLEPIWLGCSLERYVQTRSYDDFMARLADRPEHASSDLVLFWRMSTDVGLDKYGGGHRRYMSWGYLPHEDRYQQPTIDGCNAALIMKSGVFDAEVDSHELTDRVRVRALVSDAWYDESGAIQACDRAPRPAQHNATDLAGACSWPTVVTRAQHSGLEAGPLARQLIARDAHGEPWQHHDQQSI